MENGTLGSFDDVPPGMIAVRRLWTAVIVYAVQDWLSGTLREKREAQLFLFENTGDFQEVCASAGIDPSNFRSRLLRVGSHVQLRGPLARPSAA